MKFIFAGSGSGFCNRSQNYQSNMLIESPNKDHLLIDCGSDIRHSLADINYNFNEINNVFISHLHADHIGGLEWLGFSRLYSKHGDLSRLFIPYDLVDPLWHNSLKGGMQTIKDKEATLKDFFILQAIDLSFLWENIQFTLIKTTHIYSNQNILPTYGLFIEHKDNKILFTGDTCFTPEIFMPYYNKANLIFHDCETSLEKSGVHSNFQDLKKLPAHIKQKTWLYHANNPSSIDEKKEGFLGFVKRGQVFNF